MHKDAVAHVRGGVVRLPRRPEDARRGREVDHPPAVALRAPVDRGELRHREAPFEVRPDHAVPVVLGHVEDHPLAQDAVRRAVDGFAADDQLGLWEFSTQLDGSTPWLQVVPVGPAATTVPRNKRNSARVVRVRVSSWLL